MKIHHLRNATFVIEAGKHHILVDPMLGDKGSLPPYAYLRHPPRRNPLVALPDNGFAMLDKVTHCLITHSRKWGIQALQHTDHLDTDGESFLRTKDTPVVTPAQDAPSLKKRGLHVFAALDYWQAVPFLGGAITAVPAMHGRGWVHHLMANGAGYFLRLPGEPSLYISGDTVYTEDVDRVLAELKPAIAVVAAGSASLDVGRPILMDMEEILAMVERAPGKVVANHLEALNHCPTTRIRLKKELDRRGLSAKVWIPQDGDSLMIGEPVR
jgi:L-ascorbate metabolism protein UlaG (beta-lactamase superfamily)